VRHSFHSDINSIFSNACTENSFFLDFYHGLIDSNCSFIKIRLPYSFAQITPNPYHFGSEPLKIIWSDFPNSLNDLASCHNLPVSSFVIKFSNSIPYFFWSISCCARMWASFPLLKYKMDRPIAFEKLPKYWFDFHNLSRSSFRARLNCFPQNLSLKT